MPVPHLLKPPQDDATNIHSRTSLTLPFDTAVKAGTGYIRIYYGDGTLFKSISVTDSQQLTFSSDRKTVTISPKPFLVHHPTEPHTHLIMQPPGRTMFE